MVLFLERSKNRTPVFGSIIGSFSVTSQIRGSHFFMCMTVWSSFGIHKSTYLPWIVWQGLAALVAAGFALRTHCTRGLGLHLGGLAVLVASGFTLRIPFACGLGLCPLGLASLVASALP